MVWVFWLLSLLLVILVMLIIYRFSAANSTESSKTSMGICRRLARWLAAHTASGLGDGKILEEKLVTPIRKMAHFTEYALLGFLLQLHLFFAENLKMGRKNRVPARKQYASWGILFAVLYAISDEIHQHFVPGRACRILDVCIDTCGVLWGTIIFFLIFRRLLDALLRRVYNGENQ